MTTLMTPSPAAQPFVDPVWDAEIPAVDFVGRALSGALTGRLVSEITELGVPDALVGGPRQPADLAAELGADADVLARVLRLLPQQFASRQAGGGTDRRPVSDRG